jgi:hypothetical protein
MGIIPPASAGWLFVRSLVLAALALGLVGAPPPVAAQPGAADFAGLWRRDDGGLVRITAKGDDVVAVFEEVATQLRDTFGFSPGDEHFFGTVTGQSMTGSMHTHLPVTWKSRCPEQWARTREIELTLAPDGRSIRGRWKQHHVDNNCKEREGDWQPRSYTRVLPAVAEAPGRLVLAAARGWVGGHKVELILDASGSMLGLVGGRTKLDIAKDALIRIIEDLPDDTQAALRVYGHRVAPGAPGACQDSELVVSFARVDKRRLVERIRAIRALGTTPIAYSLRQVAADLAGVTGDKRIILVTDGKEECGGSPVTAAAELLDRGLRLQINVVGFALADDATKRAMERVAQVTGGRFFDAAQPQALRGAIERALAVPYDVLDATSVKVLARGEVGGPPVEVPPGTYSVAVHLPGTPLKVGNVRVVSEKATTVRLEERDGKISAEIVAP